MFSRSAPVLCTSTTGLGCSGVGLHDQSLEPAADPPGLVNSSCTKRSYGTGYGSRALAVAGERPTAPTDATRTSAAVIAIRHRDGFGAVAVMCAPGMVSG